MSSLGADDFAAWFEELHGEAPYAWQTRLVHEILEEERWPALLDLPTGSGKTAAIDIALFTLACRPQSMPRRIVYVVDRRIIVAQTAARAERLHDALSSATEGVMAHVRSALQGLAADDIHGAAPFAFAELRGGIARDEGWAMRPDVPSLLVSTVDQVGSRLLFRGYGISPVMRPIHAGLLANDCLYLLDEVQLSRAFAQTLRALEQPRLEAVSGLPRRWQVVEMSATPGRTRARTFSLAPPDLDSQTSPVLAGRVSVRKSARLARVGASSGRPVDVLSEHMPRLASALPGYTVGVVVNRVETARRVAAALGREAGARVHLLTGRMRPLDRDDAWEQMRPQVEAGRRRDPTSPRTFLVATQTIEAGADLDLDAMVTEIAPLDALRQRCGRVDRRGEWAGAHEPATIMIVAAAAQTARTFDDPVYGGALSATWHALQGRHGEGSFDAGPLTEDLDFTEEGIKANLISPSADAPLLLRHHLELLEQTSPEPAVQPEISYWLHGPQEPRPEVNVVWRADITQWHLKGATTEQVVDLLSACPPRTQEALTVPIAAARRWLLDRGELSVADVGAAGSDDESAIDRDLESVTVRWRGQDSRPVTVEELRPGDTLVVPATYGGLSAGVWDPGATSVVPDIGDRAQWVRAQSFRATKPTLRLSRAVLDSLGIEVGEPPLPANDVSTLAIDLPEDPVERWLEALQAVEHSWLRELASHLRRGAQRIDVESAEHERRFVLVGQRLPAQRSRPSVSEVLDTDGTDASHSFGGQQITLFDHCDGVGERAARYAAACGLGVLSGDLKRAGKWHDLGKGDPRFQTWLHGDEVSALTSDELLAKSTGDRHDARARRLARRRAGYPSQARHELLSVALLQSAPELLADATDPDLVLHLIASHHGFCRVFPPAQPDPAPREVTVMTAGGHTLRASTAHGLDTLGSGIVERHDRLVRRYGIHGLAWMEALLRLADHRQSAAEEAR